MRPRARKWLLALVLSSAVSACLVTPSETTTPTADRTTPSEGSTTGEASSATLTPPAAPPEDARAARVVRVVDGDTIVAAIDGEDVRVRLLRIDTPELARDGDPAECLADAATEHLVQLAPPGTPLLYATDVEALDQYGRLLAHLWRTDDGLWVNGAMLSAGFARVVTFPPNVTWDDEVLDLQREARREQRGLWGRC